MSFDVPPPIVSIIVSVYKSERFIRGKLEDIFKQSIIGDCEVIIVNSGSPENEDLYISEYVARFPNIVYLRTIERETIYRAWNRAISVARGKYITNSNTDDRNNPEALEHMVQYMEAHPQIDIAYGDQIKSTKMNETFEEARANEVMYFSRYDQLALFDICLIGSQPLWRRSLHVNTGTFFNESLEISGDHDFYLQVAKKNNIRKLPIITGTFYKPADKSNKEAENEEYRQKEGHTVTLTHMIRFVDSLSESELIDLRRLFRLRVTIPYQLLRLLHYLNRTFRSNHTLSPECCYLFMVLIHLRLGHQVSALHLAKKMLKYKVSMRMEAIVAFIESGRSIKEISFI